MKRLTFVLLFLAAVLPRAVCATARAGAGRAGPRLLTREAPLGRRLATEVRATRTISPDRRHLAFVAKVRGGEVAYVDGRAGRTYPAIATDDHTGDPGRWSSFPITFAFSRDGRRVAYVAHLGGERARGPRRVVLDGAEGPVFDHIWTGGLHFSEDGSHFVYTAERGGKHFVVVDGVESSPYEYVGKPEFRDYEDRGFFVAFHARRGGRLQLVRGFGYDFYTWSGGQQLFVVNGREFAPDDPAGGKLFYGEDAGWPREVERGGKYFVVWEGNEAGPYDTPIDRHQLYYWRYAGRWVVTFVGRRDGKKVAVINGVEGPPYDEVREIRVRRGGAHTLYVAGRGKEEFAVLDGKEGPKYERVEDLTFSADGRRHAYAARVVVGDSHEGFIVADGKEGKRYDYVRDPKFTPDGAQLLYFGYDGAREKYILVREGQEVAAYDSMPEILPFNFSPDGRRMYFELRKNHKTGKEGVVVDGRLYAYDDITNVRFSPDSRRLVFKAQRGRGWVMVEDGAESELYELDGEGDSTGSEVSWRPERLTFSKEGGRLAYIGRKGGKEFVVLDGAAGAKYDAVANLAFTPDGRHAVYTARRAGKSLVVVDGVESREYDTFLSELEHEREALNVEGNTSLSILARRGSELLRVGVEIAGG